MARANAEVLSALPFPLAPKEATLKVWAGKTGGTTSERISLAAGQGRVGVCACVLSAAAEIVAKIPRKASAAHLRRRSAATYHITPPNSGTIVWNPTTKRTSMRFAQSPCGETYFHFNPGSSHGNRE